MAGVKLAAKPLMAPTNNNNTMSETPIGIESLLDDVAQGKAGAMDRLVDAIYPELKRLARYHFAGERSDHTLNTTAVVHEAFIRLAGSDKPYKDRKHYLRAASTVMRHLLIDHARRRNADKRGAGIAAATLQDDRVRNEDDTLAVLALDTALKDMAEVDPVLESVVECRYFAGLSVKDTAEALGMSVRSVERSWQRARAYLNTAMEHGGS